jgi:hypothetical protein
MGSSLLPGKVPHVFSAIKTPIDFTLFLYLSFHLLEHFFASVYLPCSSFVFNLPYTASSFSFSFFFFFFSFSSVLKNLTMDGTESKFPQNPPRKTQKIVLGAQIGLRILVIATSLPATWVMLTSRQSTEIFGITFDARYSYSSTSK